MVGDFIRALIVRWWWMFTELRQHLHHSIRKLRRGRWVASCLAPTPAPDRDVIRCLRKLCLGITVFHCCCQIVTCIGDIAVARRPLERYTGLALLCLWYW